MPPRRQLLSQTFKKNKPRHCMTLHGRRWQLPWPSLVASLISLPFASTFILPGPTIPHFTTSLTQESTRPSLKFATRVSASDVSEDDVELRPLLNCPALRRLNLSRDELAVIQRRIDGRTAKKGRNDDVDATATFERNLAYIEERLDPTTEQLRSLVLGYPPVLRLGLETNLAPTIAFFDDALRGGDANAGGGATNENDSIDADDRRRRHERRLAAFLCESPSLLEYNVAKRLTPRLERVRKAAAASRTADGGDGSANETTLRAIATLTDSRFDEWLARGDGTGSRGDDATAVGARRRPRRPPNDPPSYVILSNLQSGGNIGNVMRSASVFGCEECIVVGQKRHRLTGDHGSRFDLPRRRTYSHAEARDYLRGKGVRIYGVEITDDAAPIMRYDRNTGVVEFPFDREEGGRSSGAAFLFGNEGSGLSVKQREICDEFLFIPQNRGGSGDGGGGSASMNVACAAAVILQAYCLWAGYSDARREGEKFLADG